MLDFGQVDRKVDFALGALEAAETMRNIQQGLAVSAGQLHLARINPVGLDRWARTTLTPLVQTWDRDWAMVRVWRRRKRVRRRNLPDVLQKLWGKHLGQSAGGADKLSDA